MKLVIYNLKRLNLSDSEKMVLLFLSDWNRPIRIGDIYNELQKGYNYDQTQQNLNYFIKKLCKKDYISWQPHSRVELLEFGKSSALHLSWHRHLLELYFDETLDLKKEDVKKEALRLTPLVSCNLINALVKKYHIKDCKLKDEVKLKGLCSEGD